MIAKRRTMRYVSLSMLCLIACGHGMETAHVGEVTFKVPEALKSLPGYQELPTEKIYLEGLASLYPGRIINQAPEQASPGSRQALAETLPRGIRYVRIYDLPGAFETLDETINETILVLDLRYLYADGFHAMRFAGYFPQAKDMRIADMMSSVGYIEAWQPKDSAVQRESSNPVIILMNHRTRGVIEPTLQDLQHNGAIITVGTHTAGETGRYRPIEGLAGYWILWDNYRLLPEKASPQFWKNRDINSLLGVGLEPEVPVEVTAEADFTGYQLLETGFTVEAVLRTELPSLFPESDEESERPTSIDPILQRAVEVILALQVLGKLPTE